MTSGAAQISFLIEPFNAASDALLHETERFRLYRRHLPGHRGSIVCKELLVGDVLNWLHHEMQILERLADVPGIPTLVQAHAPANLIVLEDIDFIPFHVALGQIRQDVRALLRFALNLTETLAALHRRGVLHRDLNPDNIVLAGPRHVPTIIDFHLATTLAEAQPGFTHHSKILGWLAYLAPEQTGRTGRLVDSRADLYSLGVILYELTTGKPPFKGTDVLQLIEEQLTHTPAPPLDHEPSLPQGLSDIVMRLLEKEPDRRYQSAEGLAHDLRKLFEAHLREEPVSFRLGELDFPMRLSPPSRLVGRDDELAALQEIFEKSLHGSTRGVLVSGASGVGKTALINELRLSVAVRRGWFISGKFDQYRQDGPSAMVQALRALGRLLLAEPDDELAAQRARIIAGLGPNVGMISALLPEFAILLGRSEAENRSPLQYRARMVQAVLDLLRAIVSPDRPIVLVIDDLQWATPSTISTFDAILKDETLQGLLLVGAFRENEINALHPLSTMLSRWATYDPAPSHLRLQNLPSAELSGLLQKMLRLPPLQAGNLAEAIGRRTLGNPFDTVELVNALRQGDVLILTVDGWRWTAQGIRRFIGDRDVVDLLELRIDRLPLETRGLLEVMACLGGNIDLLQLQVASVQDVTSLNERLEPALNDGLIVIEQNGDKADAVRFRHDRVQQAAYARLDTSARQALELAMARRLIASPALRALAAGHYLAVIDRLDDPEERRHVALLLQEAAVNARSIADYAAEEQYLSSAVTLLRATGVPNDDPDLVNTGIAWHGALYSIGKHDEADKVYAEIENSCHELSRLMDAGCVQIASLISRQRSKDSVALAEGLLNRAGIEVPQSISDIQMQLVIDRLYEWLSGDARSADFERPEPSDPQVLALAKLLRLTMGAVFYAQDPRHDWFPLRYHRMWADHGPCASLLNAFGAAPIVFLKRGDYRTAYTLYSHGLAVGEARGYHYDTAWVRHMFALLGQHWFEPLENSIDQARQAREGLLQGGDLQFACYSYHAEIMALLDTAPTLDTVAVVIAEANIFAHRINNAISSRIYTCYQYLVDTLRGESDIHADFVEPGVTTATTCLMRAHAAVLFDDIDLLEKQAAEAVLHTPIVTGFYAYALIYVLQAIALARRAQAAPVQERAALLDEFDTYRSWLAGRAEDAPQNLLHLVTWLDAERAWATGEVPKTLSLFDLAIRQVKAYQRPWHRALITERAGLFCLAHQLEHFGSSLLSDALIQYEAWGATAKVHALLAQHTFLCKPKHSGVSLAEINRPNMASADSIDMLAILRASQTLSSETSLSRLHWQVREVLRALTGATKVQLLLWQDDSKEWCLLTEGSDKPTPIPVGRATSAPMVPMSAIKYIERTREVLLVDDALQDDRFSRDPYFSGLEQCSVLGVPILSQDAVHAMLIIENHATRKAFSTDRLGTVMLLVGQLTVSLRNAELYALLERKVAERTTELEVVNKQLFELSVTDALTGLANRRRFDEVVASEWRRALRNQSSIALVIIDIDHFKKFNDQYGHQEGDRCLQRVASVFNQCLRSGSDLAVRYGGEEFALILSETDLAGAHSVAERARAAVMALQEPHVLNDSGIVTVSLGIASMVPTAESSTEALFLKADTALYQAKVNGRNRTASA